MFTLNPCMVHYCRNQALSSIDSQGNIINSQNYCLDHTPNPGKAKEDILNYIASHEKIIGLVACGMIFQNTDFSDKKFYGCNFSHCTFHNIHSKNSTIKMCIFDFAVFNDCTMIQNNSLFTSFSGCTFTHTLLTASDMIQNNFNGVKSFQSSFDDSDLYNSRFILSQLVDTSFRNCNLKKTDFTKTKFTNVSFKMSNTREATFDSEKTEIAKIQKIYGNSIVDGKDKTKSESFSGGQKK